MPIDQRANGAIYGGVAVTVYGRVHDELKLGHEVADNAAYYATRAYKFALRSGKDHDEATRIALAAGLPHDTLKGNMGIVFIGNAHLGDEQYDVYEKAIALGIQPGDALVAAFTATKRVLDLNAYKAAMDGGMAYDDAIISATVVAAAQGEVETPLIVESIAPLRVGWFQRIRRGFQR